MRLLYERHRESLILFLTGYVHNTDDAEELMMDAFAVAASGTAAWSGRSSFKTWLFAIARKRAVTFLRKQFLRLFCFFHGKPPVSIKSFFITITIIIQNYF